MNLSNSIFRTAKCKRFHSAGQVEFRGKVSGLREGSPLAFATGENGIHLVRMLFAVSLIPVGL